MSDIITHASTFSGIGASELAAEMLGWKNLFHCEINEFGRKVLEYHFPDTKSYEDIKSTDFTEWRGKVTVLTGGFPCQPFSCAGKRRGPKDDRYLWPHMLNCIKQVRPTWFIGENVVGITTMAFQGENVKVGEQADLFGEGDGYEIYEKREKYVLGEIYRNLESVGYSVQAFIIPACAVGAPHRRDRVFIVAHRLAENSDSVRCGGSVREKKSNPGNSGSLGQEVLSAYIQKKECQPSANTTSERGQQIRKQIQLTLANGKKFICDGRKRASPNSKGKRSDRYKFKQPKSSKSQSFQFRGGSCKTCMQFEDRWQKFPTQSPVYRGNDGIPFNVDGLSIPFARWKKETLKAYGNAIVPQVIYEIFLMIDEIEKME